MRAEEVDEEEGKGTECEMGSRFFSFLDEPVHLLNGENTCCTTDDAATTSFGAQPMNAATVFEAAAANAPSQRLSWEAVDDLLMEPPTWLETEPSDEEEKLEDIDSYLLSVLSSEEEQEEQESAPVKAQLENVSAEHVAPEAVKDSPKTPVGEDSEKGATGGEEDSSSEALELQRLKYAISQLDIESRIFLKDGLYRLAENAAQRETTMLAENTKCRLSTNTFETSTNSLDRAIASLLFHTQALSGHESLPSLSASSSCLPPQSDNGSHRPQPDSRESATGPPLVHNHPCAGKTSNSKSLNQRKVTPRFPVTQKSLPVRRLDRQQRVSVSSTIPGKRIKLNQTSSLAV